MDSPRRQVFPSPLGRDAAAAAAAAAFNNEAGEEAEVADNAVLERELEIAQLETRLRRYAFDLILPTIRKTATQEQNAEGLKQAASSSKERLQDLHKTTSHLESRIREVDNFRTQMSQWDHDRSEWQLEVTESVQGMRQEVASVQSKMESETARVNSLQRIVERMTADLQRLHDSGDSLREHVDRKVGQQSKLLSSMKTDVEVQLIALEAKHTRLSDELFGESTGLTKVTRQVGNTNTKLEALSSEVLRIAAVKADSASLEAVQYDVNQLINEANVDIKTLKTSVETLVSDVKDHFKTATNTVAAHSATMLSEVRNSYKHELDRSAAVRAEMADYVDQSRQRIGAIEEHMRQVCERAEESLQRVHVDIEEIARLRKRDKGDTLCELQEMQQKTSMVRDSSLATSKCLEHLSQVMWMMLESERAASALLQQDDNDRAKIALVGYKDSGVAQSCESTRAPSRMSGKMTRPSSCAPPSVPPSRPPSRPASRAQGRSSPLPSVPGTDSKEARYGHPCDPQRDDDLPPPISVDQRCLACSGQGETVLSGFKMACLQYQPGPVTFAKKTYERVELIELRQRLLEQANEALQAGPLAFSKHLEAQRALSSKTPQSSNLHLGRGDDEDNNGSLAAQTQDSAEQSASAARDHTAASPAPENANVSVSVDDLSGSGWHRRDIAAEAKQPQKVVPKPPLLKARSRRGVSMTTAN
eukprot:TRINITY_DN26748_c1_g3_i1.p1 TRINITY_DN26748_c1_g3~~TRINITY_DN26748_c1_g3_i1.p1  ORF type:complete len:703 (-),score=131.61 TRINITY_DN26748_c1_g3_i1:14-2122(-)